MTTVITSGTARKYLDANAALMMNATRNETMMGRTRMASSFANEATCVVMWRCASLNCAATGGRDYLGEEAAV